MGATLALTACGGGSASEPDQEPKATEQEAETTETEETPAETTEEAKPEKDFDGTGMTEKGDLTFYLSTPGGTSEGGNVPQIVNEDYEVLQIGYEIMGGDGTVCTVYVDGMEAQKVNAGEVQDVLDLSGDALAEGVHTVELVAESDGEVTIYKSGQYEIVS